MARVRVARFRPVTFLYPLLGSSSGTEIFVDYANGNDTTGNGTFGNPYKSIEKGRDQVATNGIISLRYAGGTIYRPLSGERWTLQKNGASAADPITLRTWPGDNPNYVTGANMAQLQGSILCGGTSTRYGAWKFQDLDIQNTVGLTRGVAGVEGFKIENFRDVEIMRCWIHRTVETGILVTGSVSEATRVENWHAHHNKIFRIGTSHPGTGNNHDHGLYIGGETVGGAHNGQMFSNIIYDCHYGTCTQFYPYATNNICVNNSMFDTSEQNAPDGTPQGNAVMLFWGTSGGTSTGMVNNLIASNILGFARQNASGSSTSQAIETPNSGVGSGNLLLKNLPVDINNASMWSNDTMWANNSTRNADNLSEATLAATWANVATGAGKDFHLVSGSPARGAAMASYMPDVAHGGDFFGNPFLAPDCGAVAYI